jgi:hypothetical protein
MPFDAPPPFATPAESRASAIADFTALFRTWPGGRRAITIGGSTGKGLADKRSDVNSRIFHEDDPPWPDRDPELWKSLWPLIESWKTCGVFMNGVWPCRSNPRRAGTTSGLMMAEPTS